MEKLTGQSGQGTQGGALPPNDPTYVYSKIYALNLYEKILSNSPDWEISDRPLGQKYLLRSGLVAKYDNIIKVANPIYR